MAPCHWIEVKGWVKKRRHSPTLMTFYKSNQYFTLIQHHHIDYFGNYNVDSTSFCPVGLNITLLLISLSDSVSVRLNTDNIMG
jgi:hypothetical protein